MIKITLHIEKLFSPIIFGGPQLRTNQTIQCEAGVALAERSEPYGLMVALIMVILIIISAFADL